MAKEKTSTLSEFVGEMGNVDDPIGKSIEEYRRCKHQIEEYLIKVLSKLESQNE